MRSEELFKIHEQICNEALELMKKKNHDYAGKSGNDPLIIIMYFQIDNNDIIIRP